MPIKQTLSTLVGATFINLLLTAAIIAWENCRSDVLDVHVRGGYCPAPWHSGFPQIVSQTLVALKISSAETLINYQSMEKSNLHWFITFGSLSHTTYHTVPLGLLCAQVWSVGQFLVFLYKAAFPLSVIIITFFGQCAYYIVYYVSGGRYLLVPTLDEYAVRAELFKRDMARKKIPMQEFDHLFEDDAAVERIKRKGIIEKEIVFEERGAKIEKKNPIMAKEPNPMNQSVSDAPKKHKKNKGLSKSYADFAESQPQPQPQPQPQFHSKKTLKVVAIRADNPYSPLRRNISPHPFASATAPFTSLQVNSIDGQRNLRHLINN